MLLGIIPHYETSFFTRSFLCTSSIFRGDLFLLFRVLFIGLFLSVDTLLLALTTRIAGLITG